MHQKSKDILLPLSLFLLTIITRVPFTSKFLYHWDAVQFALALEKYNIAVHQPHPPGYFLYVMLGRFLNLFIKDANSTFVFISLIAFFCWKVFTGKHKYIYLSVIALGIAGGVRQNSMVFLLPLWVFSVKGIMPL